jgi:hypothetical protein
VPSLRRSPTRGRRDRPCAQGTVAFVLYLLLGIALVGRHALVDPAGGTIGSGPDVQVFVWGLRWWPYALAHGVDPFVSRLVWPPEGVSTLWTTTVPGLALLAAPLTLIAGSLVSWNVWCVLAPASAAWGAHLLCRELDASWWPALVGGLLFGFSAYEYSQGLAHLQLTACAVVPLIARELVRLARGRASGVRTAGRIAVLLALQSLISVEVLTTMTLIGALIIVGLLLVRPRSRRNTLSLAGWVVIGAILSAPVTGLVFIEMLRHMPPRALNLPGSHPLDLLNLILPTRQTLIGGAWATPITHQFTGNLAEQDGYLGLPLLILATVYLRTHRRDTLARTLACCMLATAILSLGPRLHVAGHASLPLPAAALSTIPLLQGALPNRLALYTALTASIIAALSLSERPTGNRSRWVLAAAAVLATLTAGTGWQPAASTQLADRIPAHSTAISLPFWDVHDRGLQLQAQDDMQFALIDKWMQDTPSTLRPFAHTQGLYGRDLPSHPDNAFTRTLCLHRVDTVIIWPGPESLRIAEALDASPPSHHQPALTKLRCPLSISHRHG